MPDSKTPYLRSPELLSRHESRLLIVDVQEKLVPMIAGIDRMLANCRMLLQGAKILGVPAFVTEQYPKGLGQTVPQLAELLDPAAEKLRFSCAEVLDWGVATAQTDNRFQIVVAGALRLVLALYNLLRIPGEGVLGPPRARARVRRGQVHPPIASELLRVRGPAA